MICIIKKSITNDFYYKNVLPMIFTKKIHCQWFLQWKCIANNIYYKNVLPNTFTMKMYCQIFLQRNCIAYNFLL